MAQKQKIKTKTFTPEAMIRDPLISPAFSLIITKIQIELLRRAAGWEDSVPILNELLSGEFRCVETLWRVCPLKAKRTIREYESVFITATFEEFDEWFHGKILSEESREGVNPFRKVPLRSDGVVSVYADYKHFNELFHPDCIPEYGSMIDLFGVLPAKSNVTEEISEYDKLLALFAPENLTLWLSTHGAHTPLHYDSYGCNVVTQVEGSKRWRLWSPNSIRHSKTAKCTSYPSTSPKSTPCSSSSSSTSSFSSSSLSSSILQQNSPCLPISSSHRTSYKKNEKLPCLRIPYEESSVYSSYDPRLCDENKDGYILPDYDITLNEGDVLFVPKHFWHFVETVGAISLSINLWLPYPMPAQPSFSNTEENLGEKCDKVLNTLEEMKDRGFTATDEEGRNKSEIVTNISAAILSGNISIGKNTETESLPLNIKNPLNGTAVHDKTDGDRSEGRCRKGHTPCSDPQPPCSDPQSHLIEALSRVLFGALKGSASCVFDTDSPRSGWLSPSEQGGTLDFSARDLPTSSNSREENDENNSSDDESSGDDGIRLVPRASDNDPDSSSSGRSRGDRNTHMSKIKKWQLMDTNTRLHLEYLYNTLEDHRKEQRKVEGKHHDGRADDTDNIKVKEIDFEAFLQRFFNALLDPESVERCLLISLNNS